MKIRITTTYGDPHSYIEKLDSLRIVEDVAATESDYGFVVAEIDSFDDLKSIANINDSHGRFGWDDSTSKKRVVLSFDETDVVDVEIYNSYRE